MPFCTGHRDGRNFVALSAPPSDTDVAKPTKARRKWLRWLLRATIKLVIVVIVLVILAIVLLYLPPVQNMIRGKAVSFLEEKTGTAVRLESLQVHFPLDLVLEGLYMEDEHGDTLLCAQHVGTSVGLRALLNGRISLGDIDLHGVRATLRQYPDSSFNFDFIADAFAGAKSAKDDVVTDSTGGFALDMGAIRLQRVHFDLDLQPAELSLSSRIGELSVSVDSFALAPFKLHVDGILLRAATVDVRKVGGEAATSSYPAFKNPLADLDIAFNTVRLDSVQFSLTTVDTGDSLWMALHHGELNAHDMDAAHQRIAMENVDLEGFNFGMITNVVLATNDTIRVDPLWLDQHDGFRYWAQDWDLAIDRLHVANSGIALHTRTDGSFRLPSHLDSEHIVYNDIDIDAHSIDISNERIALQLDSLAMRGWPEQQRMRLAVGVEATPDSVSLSNGSLSAFGNSLAFNFSAAPGDMSTAYHAPRTIPLKADVQGDVRMSELLPVLHRFGVELPPTAATREMWRMHAWAEGTARDIAKAGLELDGDAGSRVRMSGSLHDVHLWPNSTYNLVVDELVMGQGMRQVVQAFLPSHVVFPHRLSLRGNANGGADEMRSAFSLDTDLGQISGDAGFRGWRGTLPDAIDLDLKAVGLDLAELISDTALAPVSFTLMASGDHLNGPSRSGSLELKPAVLTYHGRDLSALRLNADVQGDSIFMDLTSAAEALKLQLQARAGWPGPGDSLSTSLDLVVEQFHFEDLGLTAHKLNGDGRITGNLAFTSGGFGRVALRAPGFRLFNTDRNFTFERFALDGLLGTDTTAVTLDCDAGQLTYRANLSLDSTLSLLRERLVGAFVEPYVFVPPQGRHIDLEMQLPEDGALLALVLPELARLEMNQLEGHYDSDSDALKLDLDLPRVNYDGIDVRELILALDATGPELKATLQVKQLKRDSLQLDDLFVETTNAPGALRTVLRMRDGEVDRYRIGVDLRRENAVIILHLHEDLVLDREVWLAGANNAISIESVGLRAHEFFISNAGQRVELSTGADGDRLEFSDFELRTIGGLIYSVDSLALFKGTLDGTLVLPIRDNVRAMADMQVSKLEVMGVSFGTLKAQFEEGNANVYNGTFALDHPANQVSADAMVDLSSATPHISIASDLDLHDLSAFRPFVKEYLFDVGGTMTGELNYTQQGDRIVVTGYTAFEDALIGLVQTGSVYHIPRDTLHFNKEGLALHDLEVRDADGNQFHLDGRVLTAAAAAPRLDLQLRTDRFLLVNNTAKDNPTFHGKLFGSIDLHIGGNANVPIVKGNIGVLDSTDMSIVLPGSKVDLIDHEGIVQFTAELDPRDSLKAGGDGAMLRDSLAAQLPGVDLDLRVALDRRAHFAVVIDPTTGDKATFSGEADLVFRYNTDRDMYLQGPFTVMGGGYDVEFYGLVKKQFTFVPGGTIVWDGDPLAGRMDIQAKYSTTAAPYPLVANSRGGLTEGERNTLQVRLPFDVLINMRETVQSPVISFGLNMDRLVRNSYPQVNSVLDQLSKPGNSEEMNRQVFGLLVLNTFIENESSTEQGGSSLGTTAAQNSVNGLLTQQLNRLAGNGIKGMDIELGVNTYDQTEGGQSYSRTSVDYKVTQRILNERVSLEAGGSVGSNEKNSSAAGVSNTNAPQYAIAYSITEDGRLRLRLFHENAYDMYDGAIVNNGFAIMLSRDFEPHGRERGRRRKAILEQRAVERGEEQK